MGRPNVVEQRYKRGHGVRRNPGFKTASLAIYESQNAGVSVSLDTLVESLTRTMIHVLPCIPLAQAAAMPMDAPSGPA